MNDIANSPSSSVSTLKDAELIEPMQKREISRLKTCEEVIGRNLKEFFEVGKALATIKNESLYREDFKTFEQYCEEKWDFGRKRAYQLINASNLLEKMSTIVDIPLPKNEAQIRPLLKLPEEKITETWKTFIAENGPCKFSAKNISNYITQQKGNSTITSRKIKRKPNHKNESLGLTFELSNLVKKLKKMTALYQENEDLQLIIRKLDDCTECIQEICLQE